MFQTPPTSGKNILNVFVCVCVCVFVCVTGDSGEDEVSMQLGAMMRSSTHTHTNEHVCGSWPYHWHWQKPMFFKSLLVIVASDVESRKQNVLYLRLIRGFFPPLFSCLCNAIIVQL